jgi:predicted acetyltransferase
MLCETSGGKRMDLQLVKMSEKFKPQLLDMMDEWTKTGETIIPWAIRKVDYHDFDAYLKSLEIRP